MRLVQVCMEPGIAGEHTHKAGETQLHANTHRKLKPGRRRGPQGLCYFACSMPLGDEDVNSPASLRSGCSLPRQGPSQGPRTRSSPHKQTDPALQGAQRETAGVEAGGAT